MVKVIFTERPGMTRKEVGIRFDIYGKIYPIKG